LVEYNELWNQQLRQKTMRGATAMGLTFASIGLIIVSVVIAFGMYASIRMIQNPMQQKAVGRVTRAHCSYQQSTNASDCIYEIEYYVSNQRYVYQNQSVTNQPFERGNTVNIYYNPDSPSQCQLQPPHNTMGIVFVTILCVVEILTILFTSFIFANKGLAYVSGISKVFLSS